MNQEKKNSKEVPEDLGIKIGTPEEVYWTDAKKKCEEDIINAKHAIEISEMLLKHCEKKIAIEQKKMKSDKKPIGVG